jgi:hypothetical protein
VFRLPIHISFAGSWKKTWQVSMVSVAGAIPAKFQHGWTGFSGLRREDFSFYLRG